MIQIYADYLNNNTIHYEATRTIKELITKFNNTPNITRSILSEETRRFIEELRDDASYRYLREYFKDSPKMFLIRNIPRAWREVNRDKFGFPM